MKKSFKPAMATGGLARAYERESQDGDVQLCHFHYLYLTKTPVIDRLL
jgi:hypothetical protein